jgi:pimeloyl-ACP methyl ester carboxylesterase
VIGFNRRGHGLSDMATIPPTIPSLAEDTRRFMDTLALGRTILVGHSLGGREISELGSRHPKRVTRLVYLDGAVDMRDRKAEPADPLASLQPETPKLFPTYDGYVQFLMRAYPDFRPIWGRAFDANLRASLIHHADGSVEERFKDKDAEPFYDALRQYFHPFGQIESPALAFFAISDVHPGIPDDAGPPLRKEVATYWQEVVVPWKRAAMARFLQEVKTSRAIELTRASHYVFIDRFEEVVHATRDFIIEQPQVTK